MTPSDNRSLWKEASVPPLAIGSETWPGLAKLMEECGELTQVIGKLIAYPDSPHPDGSDLPARLVEEMGDVLGALWFVTSVNGPQERSGQHLAFWQQVESRATDKYARFRNWHREEVEKRVA
jgi:hypothetical protein